MRSGTTLLRTMLDHHSHIAIPDESRGVFKDAMGFIPLFNDLKTIEDARSFLQIILQHPNIRLWKLNEKLLLNQINVTGFSNVMNYLYHHYAQIRGKLRWGEKTPQYIWIVPKILEYFPDAKIIHIIRDARDVVASQLKSFFWMNTYMAAYHWQKLCKLNQQYAQNQTNYKWIRYEELIENPKKILSDVCQFIEEPYEEAMLNFQDGIQDIAQRIPGIHNNIAKKVLKENTGLYTRYLSQKQIQLVEYLCSDGLKTYGYALHPVTRPRMFELMRLVYKLHYLLLRGLFRIKQIKDRFRSGSLLYTVRYNFLKWQSWILCQRKNNRND